jgi:hypothetical protein
MLSGVVKADALRVPRDSRTATLDVDPRRLALCQLATILPNGTLNASSNIGETHAANEEMVVRIGASRSGLA